MEHFLVRPDFDVVSKYYPFNDSPELMKVNYADGYAIVIDSYRNSKGDRFFTGDHIKQVEEGFKEILTKYDLAEHYDNLLFLVLNKKWELDQISFAAEDEYLPQKRAQELASLILAFKTTTESDHVSLNLKTRDSDISPIIKDQKLISWIGHLLLQAIEAGTEPINLLSLKGDELRGSIEKLKEVASKKIKSPYVGRKRYLADFCFSLWPYLTKETDIRPNDTTLFSDNQLTFYYDALVLLDMLDTSKIDSEPQDYMRTLMRNHIEKVTI